MFSRLFSDRKNRQSQNDWERGELILNSLSFSQSIQATCFQDKAQDYHFSSWYLAAYFGLVDPKLDFEFGGFPDLEDITLGGRHPIAEKLEILSAKRKGRMRRIVDKLWSKRIIVDLGCGIPDVSFGPRVVAEYAMATGYLGVDLLHCQRGIIEDKWKRRKTFWTAFLPGDHLEILKQVKIEWPKSLFLGGVELLDYKDKETPNQIMHQIEKVTKKGDSLILCASSRDFNPDKSLFNLTYEDPVHEIFVRL